MLSRKTQQEIDRKVDNDEFLREAKRVADAARGLKDSQLRGLQNIINTTTRFCDVENFIKYQKGRLPAWEEPATPALAQLQQIERYAREIAQMNQDSKDPEKEIALRLAHHWINIVLAEFLYAKPRGRR